MEYALVQVVSSDVSWRDKLISKICRHLPELLEEPPIGKSTRIISEAGLFLGRD